jgi:hypothetical protein
MARRPISACNIRFPLTILTYARRENGDVTALDAREGRRVAMAGASELAMSRAGLGLDVAADFSGPDQTWRPEPALRGLLAPLDHLLISGGDARLSINPETGCNEYGCQPLASPEPAGFSSSTATSISARAYESAGRARDSLLPSVIALGIDEAFDSRIEAMRGELKRHLGLSDTNVEVVFSASGTDSQLHALFLTQIALGRPLTTVIAAADQTGSGTVYTARGHHFGDLTAYGHRVRKGDPIDGVAGSVTSIALPLLDANGDALSPAESDSLVIDAVRKAIESGSKVLLQTMDSSKLGQHVPSDRCIRQITDCWPDAVQIVVDACQMRLGRRRIRGYLASGFMVLITGSKFFTGPPFSGALLVPAGLSEAIGRTDLVVSGLLDYSARSDWPKRWDLLRCRFPFRANFGPWLRWEAAIEEIRAYYSVPEAFRRSAIEQLGSGISHIIDASRSLRRLPLPPDLAGAALDDDEQQLTTIFAFTIERDGCGLSLDQCKEIYRKLRAHDCPVGQPVGWNNGSVAALRICISARHVTEAWTPDQTLSLEALSLEALSLEALASQNLKGAIDRVALIAAKIESILGG